MHIPDRFRRASGLCATVAVLTGCSNGGLRVAPIGQTQQTAATSMQTRDSDSWMQPEAKRDNLLYVSESTGAVSVYSYPQLKLVGTLAGLRHPEGECVDKSGDVWITDEANADVVEYAHGGATPIAMLKDAGNSPVDCSVNVKTGDLAVSSLLTVNGRHGRISIYKSARGMPHAFKDAYIQQMHSVGYDNLGRLFVDGIYDGTLVYAEFSRNTFTNLSLNQVFSPGGVKFDGKYMAVGDAEGQRIYQTSGASIIGSTPLNGSGPILDFFIDRKTVICADWGHEYIEVYNYPGGGSPIEALSDPSDPIGVALSRP